MSPFIRPAVLAVFTVSVACASTQQGARVDEVKMAPVVVHSETDPLTGLDGYDAQQLLELGNRLYRSGEHDHAVRAFDRLIEVFPDSEHVPAALYNAGLAFEELVEFEKAVNHFTKVVEEHPESDSNKDAHFRIAFGYGKLKKWKDVADTFWAIRQREGLSPMDELEARVGMAVGMFMQTDYATAEREFMQALSFHRKQSAFQHLPADYWVGQSRFYLGEIYAREFESTKLSTPNVEEAKWVDMMGAELEEKCSLLLRAQNNFIRTIRAGHTGWATAAGFRIGSLYETLYDDLLSVPAPPSLDEGARAEYVRMLQARVRVLVMKAIKIYERSLEMAERVGEKNEWVERTSTSLERMKDLYMNALKEEEQAELTATE